MDIDFYLPFPPIEFFTWLAVYAQFNMMIFIIVSGFDTKHKSVRAIVKAVFFASIIIIPLVTFALVTDWKRSKEYWCRFWLESPKEKSDRLIKEALGR